MGQSVAARRKAQIQDDSTNKADPIKGGQKTKQYRALVDGRPPTKGRPNVSARKSGVLRMQESEGPTQPAKLPPPSDPTRLADRKDYYAARRAAAFEPKNTKVEPKKTKVKPKGPRRKTPSAASGAFKWRGPRIV